MKGLFQDSYSGSCWLNGGIPGVDLILLWSPQEPYPTGSTESSGRLVTKVEQEQRASPNPRPKSNLTHSQLPLLSFKNKKESTLLWAPKFSFLPERWRVEQGGDMILDRKGALPSCEATEWAV